jgi:hypothetical protein
MGVTPPRPAIAVSGARRITQMNDAPLPARFARRARRAAIILVRESAAATAAAGTTAAAAAAAARTSSTAFGLGARFVHLQVAAAEIFAVERGDGLGGFVVIRHFNESETAGAAGLAVHYDVNARDLTEGLKQRLQIALGGLKTHISNKQILHFSISLILPIPSYTANLAAIINLNP